MKLRDVIAEYVSHQQSLGHNPNPRKSLLLTFNRNAGNEIEVQDVNTDRVLTFLGRPTTDYWRQKYSALACFYRYAISRWLRNFIASAKEDFKSLPAVCSVYLQS
jgi:hypothetical protein